MIKNRGWKIILIISIILMVLFGMSKLNQNSGHELIEAVNNNGPFYEKSPQLIARGKKFDFKYQFFNYFDPNENQILIVIKNDRSIKVDKIEMEYLEAVGDSKVLRKIESDHFYHINEVDMNLTVCNFSDIFPNGQVSEIEPSDLKYVNFIVHYDGTKEEFGLAYNREEMINLYKPFDSFTEEDLKNDEATLRKKTRKWAGYLDKLYYFDSEKYMQEVANYINIISKTENKEVLNKATVAFSGKNRTFKLLDKEYVQRLYTNFSNLYFGKDSLIEKDEKQFLYEILIGLYDALEIRDNEKFNRILKEEAWDYPMDEFLQPE